MVHEEKMKWFLAFRKKKFVTPYHATSTIGRRLHFKYLYSVAIGLLRTIECTVQSVNTFCKLRNSACQLWHFMALKYSMFTT